MDQNDGRHACKQNPPNRIPNASQVLKPFDRHEGPYPEAAHGNRRKQCGATKQKLFERCLTAARHIEAGRCDKHHPEYNEAKTRQRDAVTGPQHATSIV